MKIFYFAYGSNMDADRLKERLEKEGMKIEPRGRKAKLVSYRLTFDKKSTQDNLGRATIEASPGEVVWGVLYELPCHCLDILDKYEGVKSGHYRREEVKVCLPDGTEVRAVTYIALPEKLERGLRPPRWYLKHLLKGAEEHGLPKEYIKMLERTPSVEAKECSKDDP